MPPRTPFRLSLPSLFSLLLLLAPLPGAADAATFWPNDPYFAFNESLRPDFPGQWHLYNGLPAQFGSGSGDDRVTFSNARQSAGLKGAWDLGYTGQGVIIGIVDDGVDAAHPDLSPNYRADLSKNFSANATVAAAAQGPQTLGDNHGTAVAGVAAARGGNAIGGTGAAPYAQIAALRINIGDHDTDEDPDVTGQNYLDAYYWKSGVNPTTGTIEAKAVIQVKNHSYGPSTPFLIEDKAAEKKLALERTAANNVIHVFSAGNDRGTANEDSAKTYEGMSSAVIVVAALGSDGRYADYSSFGANVFVTAPSNRTDGKGFGITTTDRVGENVGYNRYSTANPKGDADDSFPDRDYTSTFGGTSSSAPLVSGIMALGKEANPQLDVRMAKHLLVRTSDRVDSTDSLWRTNGAGYAFNPNYGFGNINAGAFVTEAARAAYVTKQTVHTQAETFGVPLAIPDNDSAGVSRTFTLTGALLDQPLEGVEVGLKFTHTRRGDLTATLTSPAAMFSRLFTTTAKDTAAVTNYEWTFLTNAFWGETGIGLWTLTLADVAAGQTGTWSGYSARFLMGKIVFQSKGRTTQAVDIQADSLFIDDREVIFEIPKTLAGISLEVQEGVVIEAGELIVNGALTETAGGPGSEIRLAGGTIGGIGTITASRGLLNTGGVVSPGNSVGTLTVNGNYTQGASGRLFIEVDSTTVNDLLAVNGAASLDGTLETDWRGGYTPAVGTAFGAFLTATGGVTGRFSRLLTNLTPTLVFKPRYDVANQVSLVAARDYANPRLAGYLTANGQGVGAMLTGAAETAGGDLGTVLDALDGQVTYSQTASAIEQLAPINGAVPANLELIGSQYQAGRIADRLGELRLGARGFSLGGLRMISDDSAAAGRKPIHLASNAASLAGMIAPLSEPTGERWGLFAKGDAMVGEQRGAAQGGYDFATTGVTVGVDYRFSERFVAGIMAGLQGGRAQVNDAGSKVKLDADGLGLYGTYYRQAFYIDGLVHYGRNRFDNTRRIVFPGLNRTALSKPDGSQVAIHGGMGYDFKVGPWMITPACSLQYVRAALEGYSETGADALNLRVDRQVAESLRGSLGGRISRAWEMAWGSLVPGVRAAYSHEFGAGAQTVQAALVQGSTPFNVESTAPTRHSLLLGADVTALLPGGMQAFVGYNGQIGDHRYQAHGVNGGVRFAF